MRWQDAALRGTRLIRAKLTGGRVPFHVILCVTARCNLRCVYCSCPSQRDDELTTAEWCRALDEFKALGTERVQFFGGEPLLRPDLGELAAHARGLGLRSTLVTNGILVPRHRDVVSQMHTVVLSLDGDEAAHDANRGRHSHAQTLDAIRTLRAWGVPVKVNAVLNANNSDDLSWLLTFTHDHRIPLSLNVMRSQPVGLWNDAPDHRLDGDRMRALIDRIIEAKRRYPQVLFSESTYALLRTWPDFTRDRWNDNEVPAGFAAPVCFAGRFHCYVYADGRLFPCVVTSKQLPAKNIRDVGVAAALETASQHSCRACSSACMNEVNSLFALEPRVVASLARAYLARGLE